MVFVTTWLKPMRQLTSATGLCSSTWRSIARTRASETWEFHGLSTSAELRTVYRENARFRDVGERVRELQAALNAK